MAETRAGLLAWLRCGCRNLVRTVLFGTLLGWAAAGAQAPVPAGTMADTADLVIVAVHDRPEPTATPGGTPRADYRRAQRYAGSDSARALAGEVARDHGLSPVSAWTIEALRLRCMVYRIAAGADRAEVLARLGRDPRVQLAQTVNAFTTLSGPMGYDDPYIGLQHGFAAIGAAAAQRAARGERVRVAVIDTAIDAAHADFGGRVTFQRDFVGLPVQPVEHHGTQVAGVIAAAANNGLGIAGVAPLAEVLSFRACWGGAEGAAHCNSYTLAQALAAAIAAGAEVINLSLGGPRDPLLERLVAHAIGRGSVVVGATGRAGSTDGFPGAVPGVLMVAASEDPAVVGSVLRAPGQRVITLMAGGTYDFGSGSSLAAAHVSGAVALLRSLDASLRSNDLQRLLRPEAGAATINLCLAVSRLRASAGVSGCGPTVAR